MKGQPAGLVGTTRFVLLPVTWLSMIVTFVALVTRMPSNLPFATVNPCTIGLTQSSAAAAPVVPATSAALSAISEMPDQRSRYGMFFLHPICCRAERLIAENDQIHAILSLIFGKDLR